MPLLDAIPVNVFIIGTSILAGVILFLILWKIPDDEEEMDEIEAKDDAKEEVMDIPREKKSTKKKSSKK